MATHDRRTRDTNINGSTYVDYTKPLPVDQDYDQVRRPQGSVVIELHNPNPPLAVGNKIGGQYAQ